MKFLLVMSLLASLVLNFMSIDFSVKESFLVDSSVAFYKKYQKTYKDMTVELISSDKLTIDKNLKELIKKQSYKNEDVILSYLEYKGTTDGFNLEKADAINNELISNNLTGKDALWYLLNK